MGKMNDSDKNVLECLAYIVNYCRFKNDCDDCILNAGENCVLDGKANDFETLIKAKKNN